MIQALSRTAARNIFYGGSVIFFIAFAALTAHSHWYMLNVSTDEAGLTDQVRQGKHVWEKNSCINCHTILGEGAYFAPELGNVWTRYGGREKPGGRPCRTEGLDTSPASQRAGAPCHAEIRSE
jgi:nitric oxide reductase subunit C